MKVFTQRNMMIFDLFIVSIFGLSLWHMPMGRFLTFSLVLLRIFTTFSLQDKRKANWIPVSINTIWIALITFTDGGDALLDFILNPIYELVKIVMSFLGCSELGMVDAFDDEGTGSMQQSYAAIITLVVGVLFYLWFLMYPIVVYIRQWRKKEFSETKILNGSISLVIVYTLVAVVLLLIADCNTRGIGDLNVWIFLMSGLPLVMYLKEKRPLSNTCKSYLFSAAIILCAYAIGTEMEHYPSFIGIVMLPALFYCFIRKNRQLPMQYLDWSLLFIASISFFIAQFGCTWERIMFLTISAVAYGYEAYILFKNGQGKLYSVWIFFVMAFIIPTMTLGYNQYSVLNARKWYKYEYYDYACNGLLTIYNPKTDAVGMRDRYGEIIPCRYDHLSPLGDHSKPFVKVRKDFLWGIYDIEKNKPILEPSYKEIERHSENYYRLIAEDGTVSYLQLKSYYYSGYEDDELWQIVDSPNEDLLMERVRPATLYLTESNVENRPQISHIYNYLVSTYSTTEDARFRARIYWEWAEKCTRLINRIGEENNIFISDTARISEQAVTRIHDMLDINCGGNQAEMNCYSLVRSVTSFYLAIDNNQQLVVIS